MMRWHEPGVSSLFLVARGEVCLAEASTLNEPQAVSSYHIEVPKFVAYQSDEKVLVESMGVPVDLESVVFACRVRRLKRTHSEGMWVQVPQFQARIT